MKVHDSLYLDGEWVRSSSAVRVDVHNAATEETIERVPADMAGF